MISAVVLLIGSGVALGDIASAGLGVVGGVVGGVAGAGATAWFTARRAQKRAPKLSMLLPDDSMDPVSSTEHATKFPSLWLHFVVQNEGSGDTANDVEVVVTKVRSTDGVVNVPVRPLTWSPGGRDKINLSPGNPRRIDVAHVLWPPNPQTNYSPPWPPSADDRTTVALVLALYPRDAYDSRPVLDPGTYELDLELTGRDVSTSHYNATIVLRDRADVWDYAEDPGRLVPPTADGALQASEASVLEVQPLRLAD